MIDRLKRLLTAAGIAILMSGSGHAESAGALSERSYQQLARVHDLMGREDYAQALQVLDALRPRLKYSDYEHAVLLQTYGYLYAEMERYDQAIAAIRESLALKSLPRKVTRDLLYLCARLRALEADYAGSVTDLIKWFEGEKAPEPEPHALAGVAYAQLGDYSQAIKHLELAVETAAKPQQRHLRQLLSVYTEAREFGPAAALLQGLIASNPDHVADWRQLSAVYHHQGDYQTALAVLKLAHRRGLLASEQDLLTLANYHLYMDAPDEAAQLLESSIKKGAVESTSDNWEILAGAWSHAKETAKAIQGLARAAALKDRPQLHLKRARLAAAVEDWDQVLESTAAVLRSESPVQPGESYLLAGIAHHQCGEAAEARDAFNQAKEYPAMHKKAQQWLDYSIQDGANH